MYRSGVCLLVLSVPQWLTRLLSFLLPPPSPPFSLPAGSGGRRRCDREWNVRFLAGPRLVERPRDTGRRRRRRRAGSALPSGRPLYRVRIGCGSTTRPGRVLFGRSSSAHCRRWQRRNRTTNRQRPQTISGNVVVNGKLEKTGDVDCYAVTLKKGQTLVAAAEPTTRCGRRWTRFCRSSRPTASCSHRTTTTTASTP